jgi:hypothetical protein
VMVLAQESVGMERSSGSGCTSSNSAPAAPAAPSALAPSWKYRLKRSAVFLKACSAFF